MVKTCKSKFQMVSVQVTGFSALQSSKQSEMSDSRNQAILPGHHEALGQPFAALCNWRLISMALWKIKDNAGKKCLWIFNQLSSKQ